MSRRLDEKVVFITGAASGLGRSHAHVFAAEGAAIALFDLGDAYRDAEPNYPLSTQRDLDETVDMLRAAGARAIGLTGDVRQQETLDAAVEQTLEEFGKIDVLIANAGIIAMGHVWEMSRDDWDLLLSTNLTGTWQSCKAVIPHMIERRTGRILLTTSTAGAKAWKLVGAYAATKAAIIRLGETLAIELAPYGITVNTVCPSGIPSGANRGLAQRYGLDWNAMLEEWRNAQAIPELLEPSDVSNALVFLAADESGHITGVTLPVDGGTTVM